MHVENRGSAPTACREISTGGVFRYVHSETSPKETKQIQAHLQRCATCREVAVVLTELKLRSQSLPPAAI